MLKKFTNKIYKIDKNGKKKRVFRVKGLKIKFNGRNSVVLLHEPVAMFKKSSAIVGSDCHIEIGSSKYFITRLIIYANSDNSRCIIGENFSCTNRCVILLHKEPNLSVTVGNDCMFGTDVTLRTTDAHAIYDIETNTVQNFGKSIEIGNHCWLGLDVTIMKNVKITDNCVVGTGSIVTKNCDTANAVYAGVPAKKVKDGINWDRKTPTMFDKDR